MSPQWLRSVSDLSKNRLNVTVLKDKLQILNDLLLDDDDARNTVSSKKMIQLW